MQTRAVNGRKQVYDEVLQDWRFWRPLDGMGQRAEAQLVQRQQAPEGVGKVRCPLCQAAVELLILYDGWEVTTIDPLTGAKGDVADGGKDDVREETYQCAMACGWQAGYEWLEETLYADQDEEEEEEIFQLEEKPTVVAQPQFFTWEKQGDFIITADYPF